MKYRFYFTDYTLLDSERESFPMYLEYYGDIMKEFCIPINTTRVLSDFDYFLISQEYTEKLRMYNPMQEYERSMEG